MPGRLRRVVPPVERREVEELVIERILGGEGLARYDRAEEEEPVLVPGVGDDALEALEVVANVVAFPPRAFGLEFVRAVLFFFFPSRGGESCAPWVSSHDETTRERE